MKRLFFAILEHTDNVGGSISDQDLSERRANAVKNYLISKGVSLRNLTTKCFGEDMPIESNNTRTERAQNRRIRIKLMN